MFDECNAQTEKDFERELEKMRIHAVSSSISDFEGVNTRAEGFHLVMDFLFRHLPDRGRALALCEAYFEHFGWM